MTSYTLHERAAAIRHVIGFALKKVDDTIIDKAEAGLRVVEYLSTRTDLIKMLDRLEKEYPDVAKILKAFPGASIVDIREKEKPNACQEKEH